MNIEQYIKTQSLKKSKVLTNYFIGAENKLFYSEEDNHIKNTFKTNKKATRNIIYSFNYYIALILIIFFLFSIFASSSTSNSELSAGSTFLALSGFLIFIPFFIKPIIHFFALENKRKKKNIEIYKSFYE